MNNNCIHIPAIIHRTGGKDAAYDNWCCRCGEHITRKSETTQWATEKEALEWADYVAEMGEE